MLPRVAEDSAFADKDDLMKIVTFNVNSIRKRLHQLQAVLDKHCPEIVAFQETKANDDSFPFDDVRALGLPHIETFGQKTHYGVAVASTIASKTSERGFDWREEDQQRRFQALTFETRRGDLTLMNGYFPQGERRSHPVKFPAKQQFYGDLLKFLQERCSPDDLLLTVGDMNVAPDDLDVLIGEKNAKRWLSQGICCFLPEEREWLGTVSNWGLLDCYAELTPDEGRVASWFDYRSRGFEDNPKRGLRIDLLLATRPLFHHLRSTGIDLDIRAMTQPSDHAPVWCEFDL